MGERRSCDFERGARAPGEVQREKEKNKLGFRRLPWTFSPLDVLFSSWRSLPMSKILLSFALACAFELHPNYCRPAYGFGQVTASTAAAAGLEKAFVAQTTTQFKCELKINPLVSNTYSIKLIDFGEPQTVLGNSFDECISQGFSDGMDDERYHNLVTIQNFQLVDLGSGTCAGVIVDSVTARNCQYVYNLIGNSISERWNNIYTSSGVIVAP